MMGVVDGCGIMGVVDGALFLSTGAVYQGATRSKLFKVKKFIVKESVVFPIEVNSCKMLEPPSFHYFLPSPPPLFSPLSSPLLFSPPLLLFAPL